MTRIRRRSPVRIGSAVLAVGAAIWAHSLVTTLATARTDDSRSNLTDRESTAIANAAITNQAGGAGVEAVARALRTALAAREGGDRALAAQLFGKLAGGDSPVADYAARLQIEVLLDADEYAEAIEAARGAFRRFPHSPLLVEFRRLEGDAFFAVGNEPAARAAWESALAASDERAVRDSARKLETQLQMSLAESYERAGNVEQAASHYRKVWIEDPTSEAADEADSQLAALQAQAEAPLRTAQDWRRHADGLRRARYLEAALAAYDTALALGLEGKDHKHAATQRAHCLFSLRRYSEAEAAFQALAGDDVDLQVWWARSIARTGDTERAIAKLHEIATTSAGPHAVRARYLAGLLLEDDDVAAARADFEKVTRAQRSARTIELIQAAQWRLGWSYYQDGQHELAGKYFEQLMQSDPDRFANLQSRYWWARTLDHDAARAVFAEIARDYPMTYYGWRSRLWLNGSDPLAPAAREITAKRGEMLPARDLARVQILADAGLDEAALAELESLAGRARSLDDRLILARLNRELGAYHEALRLMVGAYDEWLAGGPVPGHEEMWALAWPRAYDDLVLQQTTGRDGVEPELVYAIMREESGYRPEVVSTAGARGLLQIMPTTGERLAREVGMNAFSADRLFEPQVNISLGALYLGQLTQLFEGRLSAAIGSYNAGPEAIARWLAQRPDQDDDEWVESIPYSQTRAYVKRVLRSWFVYREIY